jgi:tRNA-specific 2-thiouridylase
MSGGVDSAVAAARAHDAGHDVTGVHLALARNPQTYRTGARGCCTLEDSRDARRAADVIGIPFYVWDMADQFHESVVDDFVAEYAAGRTPNPCLRCNEKIKFAAVLDRAVALGFDAVVTGHHARLGADGDTRGFLSRHLGSAPGDIVDGRTGEKVGTHDGAYAFTVGQRKGLDLRVPAADGRPRYVLSITPVTNTVTVGPREDLAVDTVTATRPIWHGEPTPVDCDVQLRAHGEVFPASVTVDGGALAARLGEPARGVAAGQAIVAYRRDPAGDIVLGSATITAGAASVLAGEARRA